MVTKYEKGDIVRVRSDLVVGKVYNDITLLSTMNKFVGKTWEIRNIVCEDNHIRYELDNGYFWDEVMLESMEEEEHMSAEEILEWLSENYDDSKKCEDVFGKNLSISQWGRYGVKNVLSKIEEDIRNKKQKEEEKEIETEFRYVFRIIEDKDGIKKCVDEKLVDNDVYFTSEQLDNLMSTYLKEYYKTHKGNFFCTYQRNCYVKGN